MKIFEHTKYKLSWFSTKFLQLSYEEMCSRKKGELEIRSWESKGYVQ